MQTKMNVGLTLQAFLPSTSGISRASFGAFISKHAKAMDVSRAIQDFFGGRAAVIPGTLKVSTSGVHGRVEACLKAVRPAKAVTLDEQGRTPGFTMVSKNLYMDMTDRTQWNVQRDGDRTVLIRTGDLESDEALNKIMSSMVSVSGNHQDAVSKLVDQVQALASDLDVGVLVSYLQPGTNSHKLGFSLSGAIDDKVEIVPMVGPVESVSVSHLIRTYGLDEYQKDLVEPPMVSNSGFSDGKVTKKDMIDYYRKVFGYNDAFFSKWERAINSMGA